MKRIVITCDYCGTEVDAERTGDLELFFVQGVRNLSIGERQRKNEKEETYFARVTHPRDACPVCMQKAADALGLRLDRDADGYYYFTRIR